MIIGAKLLRLTLMKMNRKFGKIPDLLFRCRGDSHERARGAVCTRTAIPDATTFRSYRQTVPAIVTCRLFVGETYGSLPTIFN